jgi:hypothetical protein
LGFGFVSDCGFRISDLVVQTPSARGIGVHGTATPVKVRNNGWQRQAESSELADGLGTYSRASGKLRLPLPPMIGLE